MIGKEFSIQKNVLDLEHSESLSKGITEVSIALSSFISITLSIFNKNLLIAIVVACIFALMFLIDGSSKLENCTKIRDRIKELRNKYTLSG